MLQTVYTESHGQDLTIAVYRSRRTQDSGLVGIQPGGRDRCASSGGLRPAAAAAEAYTKSHDEWQLRGWANHCRAGVGRPLEGWLGGAGRVRRASWILTTWITRLYRDILGTNQYMPVWEFHTCIYGVVPSTSRNGRFIDTEIFYTLRWFSNVRICKHTYPMTRHRNMNSKMKKLCADHELYILCSYGYIHVYTENIPVYSMWVKHRGQLSCFLL